MYTIDKEYIYECEIKRSRFISRIYPVETVDEAMDFLQQIRKLHYDATHNCYSYIIGEDQSVYKQSDDGEPSQTAGIPIYETLRKNKLTNVICIITRYYGKIKLGAGGLIRAYTQGASEVIKNAELKEIINFSQLKISFNYDVSNEVFKHLEQYEIISKSFSSNIECIYNIPTELVEELKKQLINITRDKISITILNEGISWSNFNG